MLQGKATAMMHTRQSCVEIKDYFLLMFPTSTVLYCRTSVKSGGSYAPMHQMFTGLCELHPGFHTGFRVGGAGKQDGSRMIVACVSMRGY